VEYELWENGIQQEIYLASVFEGVSKLLWREGARDAISLRCWYLPRSNSYLLTIFVDL